MFGSAGGSANSAPGGFDCGGNGGVDGSENGQDATCPGGGGGGGFNKRSAAVMAAAGTTAAAVAAGPTEAEMAEAACGWRRRSGMTGYWAVRRGAPVDLEAAGARLKTETLAEAIREPVARSAAKRISLTAGAGAMGGAIFNDSGTVIVTNSTFTGNHVARGDGGSAGAPGAADNGADAAAPFSVNGPLTIQDATISGNQSTGSAGGGDNPDIALANVSNPVGHDHLQ